MKWKLFFCSLIFLSTQSIAQVWEFEKEWRLTDTTQRWVIDEWGQLYQWQDNSISLRNVQTGQLFHESFKNFGDITGVYPLNGLRSLIFSEEQQMIGILDNTLQLQRTPLNLSELGFEFVTAIATSARPDFIWLFDQYRSRLVLFNLQTMSKAQVLDNSFPGEKNVVIKQLFEEQSELLCLLENGQVFRFDRNLTLIDQFKIDPQAQLFSIKNQLWMTANNSLKNVSTFQYTQSLAFPEGQDILLQVFNEQYYFQKAGKIYVYKLKM
jgi:hypothetical protein